MVRVSVIIPCYNREHIMGATLESLCAQTYADWEAIIVDDGSQDQSVVVARRFAGRDRRFRVVLRQGDRKGANLCRNQGLALAQGEYVIFLDSDDLLSPACLKRRVEAMDAAPDCGFGIYQTELFGKHIGDRKVLWNAYEDANDLHRFLSLDSVWSITGPIWRKQTVVNLGGFDQHLPSFQDWAMSVNVLIAGTKYFKAPIRDHFYRHGPNEDSAINKVSCTEADHLQSHQQLFEDVLLRLRKVGLLDHEILCRVTGLFWWLSKRWQATGRISEGDKAWHRALEIGLISRRRYWEGRLILRLQSFRGGGRLAQLVQCFWPSQYYRHYSPSWQNAPVKFQSEP